MKVLHFNSHMGRMGNQMFQYACAKAMQWEHGFSTSLSDLDKLECFKLEKNERLINRIRAFLFFRLWKPLYGMDILKTSLECLHRDYQFDLQSLQKPTMVWGFFQSPLYFQKVSYRIQECFEIKHAHKHGFQSFLKKEGLKAGEYLAIHIRRTDYKGFTVPGLKGDDFTLPLNYYHNALKEACWKGAVVFVSDDPDSVSELFSNMDHKIVSKEDAVTDFLILQNARAVIISNSTFAWWAAWLNQQAQIVYCPKYFLGFKENKEVPVNIYPETWKQISVYEN